MNRTLLVCRSCLRIRGCSDPIAKWCGACTTHDCPTLPARQSTVATCEACAVKGTPTVLAGSRAAPRAETAPAWLA